MKRKQLLFLLVVAILSFGGVNASPVEITRSSSTSYASARSDVDLSLRLIGGKGSVFMPGRDINLTFETSRDAYVVIYGIDSEGLVQLLFPMDGILKKVEGQKVHFLPERDGGIKWEVSGKTGMEYIHAVAVTGMDRIDAGELRFLAQNAGAPADRQYRIDSDPMLAFNTIDEALVLDAPGVPIATDYTYFYINREVDYPRYLCSKCHGEGRIADPYAMECPEIVIEKLEYENEDNLQYPYPSLFAIRHVGGDDDYYESSGYADNITGGWDDEDYYDDDSNIYLSIYYTDYDYPHRFDYPAFRSWYFSYYDPWRWDYDPWGWGFSFTWGWDDYYYHHWPYQSWYSHRYNWYNWNCMYGYNYCCGGWYTPWYHHGHHFNDYDHHRKDRSVYADRSFTKRNLNYAASSVRSSRDKTVAGSRLGATKTAAASARKIEREKDSRAAVATRRSVATSASQTRSSLEGSGNGEVRRRVIHGIDNGTRAATRTGQPRGNRDGGDPAVPSTDSGTRRMYRETGKSANTEKNSRSRLWRSRDTDRTDPARESTTSPDNKGEDSQIRKRTERISNPAREGRKSESRSTESRKSENEDSVRKNSSSSGGSAPARSSSSGSQGGSSSGGKSGGSGREKKR